MRASVTVQKSVVCTQLLQLVTTVKILNIGTYMSEQTV